jgi:hypothetical protein
VFVTVASLPLLETTVALLCLNREKDRIGETALREEDVPWLYLNHSVALHLPLQENVQDRTTFF